MKKRNKGGGKEIKTTSAHDIKKKRFTENRFFFIYRLYSITI